MELFKLFGTIMVDNKKANKSISKSNSLADKLSGRLGKGVKVAAKFGAALTAATGAGATALFGLAKKSADATDRIDKLSQRLGMSRKGFQEWDFILSQAGVSIDSMQSGMKKLSQKMKDAGEGVGKGSELFEKLGVSVKDSSGNFKNQEVVFEETIKALQGMDDGIEKAALAQELFGRSGQELLPLLNGEAGGVEELKQKAHELGLVLGDDAIDAGVKFTDTLDQLKRSMGSAFTQIGVMVMPIMQQFADWIIANMPTIQAVIGAVFGFIGQAVNVAVMVFRDYLLPIFTMLYDWIQANMPMIQAIFEQVWGVINAVIQTVVTVFRDYLLPIFNEIYNTVAHIMPMVLKIIQTVWAYISKVFTTESGIISAIVITVFENIKNFITAVMGVIRGIVEVVLGLVKGDWSTVWNGISTIVTSVLDYIKSYINTVLNAIKSIVSSIWGGIKSITFSIWESIKSTISGVVNGIKSTVSSVFNGVKSTVSNIWDGIKNVTSRTWDSIKESIRRPIERARDIVKGVVDKIKGFFNFSVPTPHIPMPHPYISPSGWSMGDLFKGSIPSVGIDWYAKGGIFDKPTIFNTAQGFKGVGEAGPEAVMPINKLQDMIDWNRSDVDYDKLYDMMVSAFTTSLNNLDLSINIEERELGRVVDNRIRENAYATNIV